MAIRSQSQRPTTKQASGTTPRAQRAVTAKNKDALKSDRQENMAGKPGAQKDQFGSHHNHDKLKTQQRVAGTPGGKSDLAFRESPQEIRPERGAKNRQPGRRRPESPAQKKSARAKDNR